MPSLRSTLPLALLGVLLAAGFVHASDVIPNEPTTGRSATVTQPHVTAELIAETPKAGGLFDVALHLHMDPDWHTYWINPGEAGLATTIKWTLPPGWMAGPIQWPTPEVHAMGPITTYGYAGDVYLLTTIRPPFIFTGHFPEKIDLKARVDWLVCQEECIPGKADLALTVQTNIAKPAAPDPANAAFFAAARMRLPVKNTRWTVTAAYEGVGLVQSPDKPNALIVRLKEKNPGQSAAVGNAVFYPEQANVIAGKSQVSPAVSTTSGKVDLLESLEQNGETPDKLSGVVVSDVPLIGVAKAVHVDPFPTNDPSIFVPSASLTPAPSASSTASVASSPNSPSSQTPVAGSSAAPAASVSPLLPAVLFFAFLGGLILNLMPCVLPVLSLKVFSLIRHAGDHAGGAWKQGVAFTAGVVISFWILAGLLIALESAGSHLGWGFQMQSPGFVLALIFLFFLLGLNLFGVFELGTSLVGLDAKATSKFTGLPSSFFNGALATLAATPCTAPFMGSAVGFAAQQPAAISMLVFTFLALGMAAPYLALTAFPGALKLVPKPGRWMEALKQFMGFLLMGTVIFLVYVFGALTGPDTVPMLLGALLVAAAAAWIFGRWCTPVRVPAMRLLALTISLFLLYCAVHWSVTLTREDSQRQWQYHLHQGGWQTYSPEAVQQALKQGHPAFVDFTAAWCLSCKVNEAVALDIDSTRAMFAQKNVVLFRGDWTHSDPQISETLRQFNRNGVPLYLVYSPKNPDAPQVLPEVLTPGIVQDALQKLP